MPLIDVYLPLKGVVGSGGKRYEKDLREVYEYDESLSYEENIANAKQQFLNDYGNPTINRSGQFSGGSGDRRYSRQSKWSKTTANSVVVEVNGVIRKSVNNRYTSDIDRRILELSIEKLKLKQIQEQINKEFNKDYTKVAVRDRRLRLTGRK